MRTAAVVVSLLAAFPAAASNTYVQDPLTSSSYAGRGSQGGSFGASGWTVSAEADAVWYEISDALPEARIEYTVKGLELGTSLSGSDHDILTVYQAPAGLAEPIAYSPGFRNNDFKAFTRIFGSQETTRPGAMKLELATCPQGDPWYHDTCPAACGLDAIAYANGNQNDVGWDPNASYRMALSWGNGQMTFERDGVVLGTVTYPGTYAPQPLRVRLGSPRHDGVYPGQAFMPLGITISDVVITGTPGVRSGVCGAPPVDPPDAGPGAQTLSVMQDVTGASWESGVFADANDLNVEADGAGTPTAVVYLRFPAPSGPVTSATLRLHTRPESSAAGGSGQPCALSTSSWSETTLTWGNKPAWGACAGAASSVTPDSEVAWDVTALVQAGAQGFALVSHDADGAHFLSKEADAARAARLEVVLDPNGPAPDAGVPEVDAGAPEADAGAPEADAGAPDADGGTTAPPTTNPPGDLSHDITMRGGCGCDGGGSAALAWLGLLGAARLLGARRTRRTGVPIR